jgi:hypothetical protein
MGWIADFFDISIDRANQFYAWGWRASVVGAVVTMCGVGLLWLGTRVRDIDFERGMTSLNSEAGMARERAGQLEARAAGLEKEASASKERTASLEKETALARAEQERLKGQLAWRRLTKEQYDLIVSAVRSVKLDAPLDVSVPVGDAEAATFAAEIIKSLKAGGIAIQGDGVSTAIFMPIPPTGIIFGQPGTGQVVHPLAQAFASVGFHVTVEIGAPALKLVIGSKPSQF